MNGRSVLFVFDLLETGGIQRRFLEVGRALIEAGAEARALVFRGERAEMAPAYEAAGIPVTALGRRALFDLRFFFRLRRFLRARRYDVVHALSPPAAFWTALALPRGRGDVFLGSLSDLHQFERRAFRLAERWVTSRRLDGLWVNARAVEEYYVSRIGRRPRIYRLYNGAAAPPEAADREALRGDLGIAPEEIAIVTTGRLAEIKRQADAIEAVARLRREGLAARLFLIGDGPMRGALEAAAGRLGDPRAVTFLGAREDATSLLPAFDIFTLPSGSEGLPNALLEAMAAGLPCVASRVGGVPEVVDSGRAGLLHESGNVKELTDALGRLARSPELRGSLGAAAKDEARRRFSRERMARGARIGYRRALARRAYDLAYVLSQFPKVSETFVLREIVEMRRRGLRIAIVSLKPSRERVTHPEARALLAHRILPAWFSPRVAGANAAEVSRQPLEYMRTLIDYAGLHRERPRELLKALAVWPKTVAAARALRQRGVRHIHAHWATIPTASAIAIARLLRTQFSFTPHAYDLYGAPLAPAEKTRRAAFVTTDIQRNVDFLRSIAPDADPAKIHLVRSFLKFPDANDARRSEKASPPAILAVGSLERYKGHDVLLRAGAILRGEGRAFQIWIAGGGREEAALRETARELRMESAVRFLGPLAQSEVFARYREASIFALASIRNPGGGEDNLPTVLMEAAGFGLPVVVSRVGAVEEFIEPGETGLLTEPGGAESLAAALRELLENPPLRTRLGENARRRVHEMFDLEKNASLLEHLFREALSKSRRNAQERAAAAEGVDG